MIDPAAAVTLALIIGGGTCFAFGLVFGRLSAKREEAVEHLGRSLERERQGRLDAERQAGIAYPPPELVGDDGVVYGVDPETREIVQVER